MKITVHLGGRQPRPIVGPGNLDTPMMGTMSRFDAAISSDYPVRPPRRRPTWGAVMHALVHTLHRHLWQRISYRWRRYALFRATALAAPRPSPNATPALPVIVAGALRSASGLGQSARLCHDALHHSGLDVYGVDLTSALMQPPDLPNFAFADGRAIEGPGILILHVNSPLIPLAMLHLGRRLVRNKRVIGYWAWELPYVPADWRHGVPFVHEIWAPSAFAAAAIKPIANGHPIHVMPHPVALARETQALQYRNVHDPFTVLTVFNMGSSLARKNPCAAIDAFRRAFRDDPSTRLIVKYLNAGLFPGGVTLLQAACHGASNIVLMGDTLSSSGIEALYDEADVVISLHHSEGFGLVIAEAMCRGIPVVATNWSGNVDFLNAETGMPVGYGLVPAFDQQHTYDHPDMVWAEADVDAAAAALQELRSNPGLRRRLQASALAVATQLFSPDGYARRVRQLCHV